MDFFIGDTVYGSDGIGKWTDYIPTPLHPEAPVTAYLNRRKAQEHAAVVKKLKAAAASPQGQQTMQILNYVYSQANAMQQLLDPLPEPARSYAVYATYHESAAYSSPLYRQHHNATGIKFDGQKGAVKGDNNYAWFSTWSDWANAYMHELRKGANPAGAKSLEDFAARLKQNRYYEDSVTNYLAALKRARYVLKDLPASMRAGQQQDGSYQDKQDNDIPGTKKHDTFQDWWDALKPMEKIGMGAAATLIAVTMIKQ